MSSLSRDRSASEIRSTSWSGVLATQFAKNRSFRTAQVRRVRRKVTGNDAAPVQFGVAAPRVRRNLRIWDEPPQRRSDECDPQDTVLLAPSPSSPRLVEGVDLPQNQPHQQAAGNSYRRSSEQQIHRETLFASPHLVAPASDGDSESLSHFPSRNEAESSDRVLCKKRLL